MLRTPAKVFIVAAVLVFCLFLIWMGFHGRGRARQIPEGQQTLTGSLVPAELSLSRRGTHILKVNGDDVAYAESSSVNLRLYELTPVGVTGHFALNTDPSDLPVFVVTSLRTIEIPAVMVELPSVGLTLRVPREWELEQFDDGVAFTITGSTTPLLRIVRTSLTRLPPGTPMFIGGYDAVRVKVSDDSQKIHLQAGRTILTFTWTSDDEEQSAAYAQLLRTALVRASQTSSLKAMTGGIFVLPSSAPAGPKGSKASASGPKPCGGPAGVLCPAGSYCAVNSPDGVGTCVSL